MAFADRGKMAITQYFYGGFFGFDRPDNLAAANAAFTAKGSQGRRLDATSDGGHVDGVIIHLSELFAFVAWSPGDVNFIYRVV